MVRIDIGTPLQGQMRLAKVKGSSNLLLDPSGLGYETSLWEILTGSLDAAGFDPSLLVEG